MFPVGDDNVRGNHRPWVTWALIAARVIVFFHQPPMGLDGLKLRIAAYALHTRFALR
jgi:hypothetical protein